MLPASGDDVGDGLVFISYSHDDVAWAQRFRVLLKPLVRRKHLRLWDDTQIRAGDEWHPAIEQAIERSRVALALVSADFLASDYIMERELPALLARGVLLAPVLVGDCFWSAVPELAAVRWLHDPGRDGPLGLHAGNPAERDRRIHRACDRLLTVTPEPAPAGAAPTAPVPPLPRVPLPARAHSGRPPDPASPPPPAPPPSRGPRDVPPGNPEPGPVLPGAQVVADVPAGDVAGALSRVPALPPRYLVRDELDGLVDAVVGTAAGGAVGLTGEPAGVGLHGIGGIGKSVLAAALATDDRIRRRFPDGVYWVTVGERPDVLALQLDLLSRLGARPEARTRAEAARALRAVLAEKRVLLVVDDVWSADDAQDFRVTGRRGRLLYTSRDQAVVAAAGATAHPVGVLSPAAARALAGEVLGVPAASLPAAADGAFAAVGYVPLAVALLAAAVRGRQEWEQLTARAGQDDERPRGAGSTGPSWERIAADLARDADVYGTHPYATTFRALHIAVGALPADLRAALLGLAVFPPDTAIPVAAIARYWAHTRGRSADETVTDLDRLLAAEVLQPGEDADTIGFHDLAHEYLLLHADALPTLHEQLLDAYRRLLDEPDEWWTLPVDEPYVCEHLATHLAGSGDRDTLVATVTDPAYQARRIARDGSHAGEADLVAAARAVPDDPVVGWWQAWLARHGHLLERHTGIEAPPARIAGTMLAWLRADPARPAAVGPARLTPLLTRRCLVVDGGLDAESRTLVRVLAGHRDWVRTVAWAPCGTRLATGGDDRTTRIWDHRTGEVLLRLGGRSAVVRAVAWSPDGTRLATAGDDGTIRIWDSTTGGVLLQLAGHTGAVQTVAWSPDGTGLATAGTDHSVRVWHSASGATLRRLTGHTDSVLAVAWSPDGGRLGTAGVDRSVRIWDVATAATVLKLTSFRGWVRTVAWSPDGTRLATGGTDATAQIWDPTTGKALRQLTGHNGAVQAVAWSPDGDRLATAGDDATTRIWHSGTGADISADEGSVISAASWSPDGTRLAAGAVGSFVSIYGSTGVTRLGARSSTVSSMAWSPDGNHLITADGNVAHLWATGTGRALRSLKSHTRWVRAVAWSPDGTLLATVSDDGRTRIWKIGTGGWLGRPTARVVATLRSGSRRVHAVAWSPDGTHLATAGDNRTVLIWERNNDRMVAACQHAATVHAVAWSPDGSLLAITSDDRTLRLWNPTSRELAVACNTGHVATAHSVDWSTDGASLATADATGLVIVWDRQLREVTSIQLKPSRCLAWSAPRIAVGQPGRPAILELRDPADLDDSPPLS